MLEALNHIWPVITVWGAVPLIVVAAIIIVFVVGAYNDFFVDAGVAVFYVLIALSIGWAYYTMAQSEYDHREWYNSLTPEQQQEYDAKQEEERRKREEEWEKAESDEPCVMRKKFFSLTDEYVFEGNC